MEIKITATFSDGRRRVLKSPDELQNIDKHRETLFVMDNGEVYAGYSDGEIDEDGDFCVMGTLHGIGLPFSRLAGWCYKTVERKKGRGMKPRGKTARNSGRRNGREE